MKFSDRFVAIIRSPFLVPAFLVLPVAFVLMRLSGRAALGPDLLLYNNIAFLLYLILRLAYQALQLRSDFLYHGPPPGRITPLMPGILSIGIGDKLRAHGYRVDSHRCYAERRDAGYFGTMVMLVGLVGVLGFGTLDYLNQFSAVMNYSIGAPVALDDPGAYLSLQESRFVPAASLRARLKIVKQIVRSKEYPRGATEVLISARDGSVLYQGMLQPGNPVDIMGIDMEMRRFLLDAWLVVLKDPAHILATQWVRLYPRSGLPEGYTHYGRLEEPFEQTYADVYFRPDPEGVMVDLEHEGTRPSRVVLGMGPDSSASTAGYRVEFKGYSLWSELKFTRQRSPGVIIAFALIALLGLLVRLIIRPDRVWCEFDGTNLKVLATRKRKVGRMLGV